MGAVDPTTVLLSALSVAGPATRSGADQAVKDASANLRAAIVRKFGGSSPRLALTLDDYAADPETYERPAAKALKDAGADRDREVVDEATQLLKRAERSQPGITGGLVGQINAQGGIVLVIRGNVSGPISISSPSPSRLSPEDQDNRRRMLARVGHQVRQQLEQSLRGVTRLALGLEDRPGAVPDRWDGLLERGVQAATAPLPTGTIVETFDARDGELLILGAPGSGKTTSLLDLAQALIDRAEREETLPMPTTFNLASWATRRQPLADWLVDELVGRRYEVPRKVARTWVSNDHIMPLLDGLDEVDAEHRPGCVAAINAFRAGREQRLARLVVCCRLAEYEALPLLRLRGAVLVQSLSNAQVDASLAALGDRVAGLLSALRGDAELRELATTPLLLNVMILTYQGAPAASLPTSGTLEDRRSELLSAYVESMFTRREASASYPWVRTVQWLAWLARSLSQHSQSAFYLEHLQADWLPTRAVQSGYMLASFLIVSLIVGVAFGLVYGLIGGPGFALFGGLTFGLYGGTLGMNGRIELAEVIRWSLSRKAAIVGLVAGLVGGLGPGLLVWLIVGLRSAIGPMRLAEEIWSSLSWGSAVVGLLVGLVVGLLLGLYSRISPGQIGASISQDSTFMGLVGGLVGGLAVGLIGGREYGLAFGLGCGLVIGPAAALGNGLTTGQVTVRTRPNRGIHRSVRTALLVGLALGLFGWLLFGLLGGLDSVTGRIDLAEVSQWLRSWGSAAVGGLGGLAGALIFGGTASLRHLTLRLFLWLMGMTPLNYVRFLDYATERIFLRRVGGGYIFVHRLVQEHFAANENVLVARVAGIQSLKK